MIGQKQQNTRILLKRYDDIIKRIANGSRLAVSCGQDNMVNKTQDPWDPT